MASAQPEIRSWTIWRGLAAITVVLFHFRPHLAGQLDIPLVGAIVRNGALGVDLFFVLSGMVMHRVYGQASKAEGFCYREFMAKRFARIYPVHLVTTLGAFAMFLIAGAAGLVPVDSAALASALPIHLLMLHGLGRVEDHFALNFPSWSVSAEMFAYLCFPLFARIYLGRGRAVVAWLMLLSAGLVVSVTNGWTQIGVVRVSIEFLIGMGVARLIGRRCNPPLGLALLLSGTAIYASFFQWQVIPGSAVLAFALMLGGSALAEPWLGHNRLIGALVYLGTISYSLYMVHALVMGPGFLLAERLLQVPPDQSPDWVALAVLAVTIACAAVLHRWLELPCRAWLVRKWVAQPRMPE